MGSMLAYQIGAVFLLAALLMLGTVNGGTGKLIRLVGARKLAAVIMAGVGWIVFQYRSDIMAMVSLNETAPSTTSAPAAKSVPAPTETKRAAKPAVQSKSFVPAEPPEHWKTVVVDDATPQAVPAAAPEKAALAEPESDDPCAKSQYQSKTKRWMKSVGCKLHIIPKK